MHSSNVEEVFVEDHDLRRKMAVVLRKHMAVDEEVDRETREKIKNLEEGTRTWDIEYQKVMEQIEARPDLSLTAAGRRIRREVPALSLRSILRRA
jgi:hypothetical protein